MSKVMVFTHTESEVCTWIIKDGKVFHRYFSNEVQRVVTHPSAWTHKSIHDTLDKTPGFRFKELRDE